MKNKKTLSICVMISLLLFTNCMNFSKSFSQEIYFDLPSNNIPLFPIDIVQKYNNIYILDNGGEPCGSPIIQRPLIKIYTSNDYKLINSFPIKTIEGTSFYADPIKLDICEDKVIILANVSSHIKDIFKKYDIIFVYNNKGEYITEIEAKDKYTKYRDIKIIDNDIWILNSSFIERKTPSIISIYSTEGEFKRNIEINVFVSSFLQINSDKLLLSSRTSNISNDIFIFDINTENINKLNTLNYFITDICKSDNGYYVSYLDMSKKSFLAKVDLNFNNFINLTSLNYPLSFIRNINKDLWILQIKETCNNNLYNYFSSDKHKVYLSTNIRSIVRKYDFDTKSLVSVLKLFNNNNEFIYFPICFRKISENLTAILDADYKITYLDDQKTIKDIKYLDNLELSSEKAFMYGKNGEIYCGIYDGFIRIIKDSKFKDISVPGSVSEIRLNNDGRLFLLTYTKKIYELINDNYLEKIYESKDISTFCIYENNIFIVEKDRIVNFNITDNVSKNEIKVDTNLASASFIHIINPKILSIINCDNNYLSQIIFVEIKTGKVLNTVKGLKESILNSNEEIKVNLNDTSFYYPTELNSFDKSIFITDFGNSRILKFYSSDI